MSLLSSILEHTHDVCRQVLPLTGTATHSSSLSVEDYTITITISKKKKRKAPTETDSKQGKPWRPPSEEKGATYSSEDTLYNRLGHDFCPLYPSSVPASYDVSYIS